MVTRQFPVELTLSYPLDRNYNPNRILFFDIETTGFAAESSYLYLIGCIYLKASSFHLIQWFSENIKEEPKIISSFFEFLKGYDLLVHYNGTGFDLPYLMKKCEMHQLGYSFGQIETLDLYKKISPIKKILRLENYKQKSVEAFLNVSRKDIFGGGDLIEVYQNYIGKKHLEALKKSRKPGSDVQGENESDALLGQLLLHNEDDLKGLVQICPILYYIDLFEKPIRILQAGVDQGKLTIRFELSQGLPVRVSFGDDVIYVSANGSCAIVSVTVYEGELKHFYDNYRDYYYLPEEDRAVHKSLALFVDKEYRQKAKPSNCYTKKEGLFAPQYQTLLSPCFKHRYQDKLSFIEIHTDFLLKEENLERYVFHLLRHASGAKPGTWL